MQQNRSAWIWRVLLAAVLAGLLAACGPEDGRQRGSGPGADVGNRPADFRPKSKVFDDHGRGTP